MAPDSRPHRAIVFAPLGDDAVVAQTLLREAGVAATVCNSLGAFQEQLGDAVRFAVIAEESTRSADLHVIAAWVAAQPRWSDLPFIVLIQRGGGAEPNPGAARLADILGNAILLERPFHPTTFVSVARAALKGRLRQYEARSRIEELNESEERLRTALLAGHLGTWELDLDSWTLTCSETCKAVFGRTPAQPFTYVDLLASVFPDDRPRMQVAIQRSVQTGQDLAIEYRTTRPDGASHWAELRARVLRDRGGGRLRLVGVASDITGRKEAEASLRALSETLDQRLRQSGAVPADRAAVAPPAPRTDAVARATILLVDDDVLIAMSTAAMLEDLGHEVIETHSGAKAVAILQDGRRVDVLITDFSMPGMTGLQLADAARRLRPGLPILLVTGYADLPGGEAITLPRLTKPYEQSELVAEIAKLLAPVGDALRRNA